MNWLVMVWTSLITVLSSIAPAAKVVQVDRTDAVEGMLVRENIFNCEIIVREL